jgi:hypothetical protein
MGKREKELEQAFNRGIEQGFPVTVPKDCGLENGEKFTIPGVRYMKNGTIIMNCKLGEETAMIARIAE